MESQEGPGSADLTLKNRVYWLYEIIGLLEQDIFVTFVVSFGLTRPPLPFLVPHSWQIHPFSAQLCLQPLKDPKGGCCSLVPSI